MIHTTFTQTTHWLVYFLLWHVKVFWFWAEPVCFLSALLQDGFTPSRVCIRDSQACHVRWESTLLHWLMMFVSRAEQPSGVNLSSKYLLIAFRWWLERALPTWNGSVDLFLIDNTVLQQFCFFFCLSLKGLKHLKGWDRFKVIGWILNYLSCCCSFATGQAG